MPKGTPTDWAIVSVSGASRSGACHLLPARYAAHVRQQVMAVLDPQASGELTLSRGFFELGMDSLMATEIRNRLQSSLGMPLPATLLLENGNLELNNLRYFNRGTEVRGMFTIEQVWNRSRVASAEGRTFRVLSPEDLLVRLPGSSTRSNVARPRARGLTWT